MQPVYEHLSASDPDAAYLFLALDGVSYEMIQGLRSDGYFAAFGPPSRLISTFPSSTMPGFTGLFRSLGCEAPNGYENKFFSIAENRYRGHTFKDYHSLLIPFKSFFNYYRYSLLSKTTMYAFPAATVYRDMNKIERRLLKNPQALDMVYIGGTDGAAHVLGRHRTEGLLKVLSKRIEKWRRKFAKRHHKPLHLVVYSDHGFHFSRMNGIAPRQVDTALQRRGFRLSDRLQDDRDVVTILFGNLHSGIFYTRSGQEAAVAASLSQVTGMDLVFYQSAPHEFGVYSKDGAWALIHEKNSGQDFYYEAIRGDPLGYLDAGTTWQAQSLWWEKTKALPYPDALARVYDAFEILAKNKAQVIVSTLPDFEYGSTSARVGSHLHGGLKGTHGGLFESASNAFVMTTLPAIALPHTLSYRDLFPRLLEQTALYNARQDRH